MGYSSKYAGLLSILYTGKSFGHMVGASGHATSEERAKIETESLDHCIIFWKGSKKYLSELGPWSLLCSFQKVLKCLQTHSCFLVMVGFIHTPSLQKAHSASSFAQKLLPAHSALNSVACGPHPYGFFAPPKLCVWFLLTCPHAKGQRKGRYTSPVSDTASHHTSACQWTCCDMSHVTCTVQCELQAAPNSLHSQGVMSSAAYTGQGRTAVVEWAPVGIF